MEYLERCRSVLGQLGELQGSYGTVEGSWGAAMVQAFGVG